jgi:hypothetical protein
MSRFLGLVPAVAFADGKARMVVTAMLVTAFCAINEGAVLAQAPVAIHATQAEIDIWKQRSKSGPYLDDWNRILSRAKTFLSAPDAELWPGNQTNQAWDAPKVKNGQQPPNDHPGRRKGDGLRDAGFVYLLTGDSSYRNAIRQTLLTQAKAPGTNFSDRTKWNPTAEVLAHDNFEIANWLRKLAYGYSYIRSTLSPTEIATIDAFFLNAATYWDKVIHNLAKSRFPQRYQDDYRAPASPYNPGSLQGKTHWNGYTVYNFHDPWKNIQATHNAMVAVVGVLLKNATLKDHAKRFVKEFLMFAVARDGTVVDQYRWKGATPQVGYMYAGTQIGSIVVAADHLARAGDTELYTFQTSAGFHGWAGGPKSLLLVLQRYANITIGERQLGGGVLVYASTTATTDPAKRIGPGTTHATDLVMLPANLYYQDSLVNTSVRRTMPSHPANGGYDPWGGDWGTYPGIRFMFGQQEGKVRPYPSSLKPPSNLRLVVSD